MSILLFNIFLLTCLMVDKLLKEIYIEVRKNDGYSGKTNTWEWKWFFLVTLDPSSNIGFGPNIDFGRYFRP